MENDQKEYTIDSLVVEHDDGQHIMEGEAPQSSEEDNQIEPTIEALAHEFNKHDRAAAMHIVLGGKAVSRAKAKGGDEFVKFCAKVKYNPKSSKLRKYKRIGDEAGWLLPIADRLPADWTKIFDVAVLGQTKAEALIHRGILTPQMSGKELKAATINNVSDEVVSDTSTTDETTSTTEPCILQVDASELSDQDRLMVYDRLVQAAAPHGLPVCGLPKRLAQQVIIEQEAA